MFRILKKFTKLLDTRQKFHMIVLFVMMIISALLETLSVSLIIPLISVIMQPDFISENSAVSYICNIIRVSNANEFVIICMILLIVLFVMKNAFLMIKHYAQARYVYNNQFALQNKILSYILTRPYEYFLNLKTGDVIRTINDDVMNSFRLLTEVLTYHSDAFISIALIVALLLIDPIITVLIAGLLIVVAVIIIKKIKPEMKKKGEELADNFSIAYKWLVQAVQGIKEIKINQNEKYFEDEYKIAGEKVAKSFKWYYVIENTPRLIIEAGCVSATLLVVILMIIGGREITSIVPTLSALAMAAVKLMPSANRMISCINSVAFKEPALDNILKHIGTTESLNMNKKGNNIGKISKCNFMEQAITLDNVFYKYPNSQKYVLCGASMEIPIGASVGVIGTSGSGKTTTIDLLLGLLLPEKGRVLADGKNINENYNEWLTRIGYIPQSMFLLDDSIASNIAFGMEIDDEKIESSLKEACLWEYVRALPNGIYTQIGERGNRLSGGQRQRIGIARALYRNPQILVFDEATSSLDNETESSVMDAINGLHGKKTMIIIAHRMQTTRKCDLIYEVRDKRITLVNKH